MTAHRLPGNGDGTMGIPVRAAVVVDLSCAARSSIPRKVHTIYQVPHDGLRLVRRVRLSGIVGGKDLS